MKKQQETFQYLSCEQRIVYYLLIAAAGMMGAYTFNLRGGVFCNAQTANVVMMSMAFGKGEWKDGIYFLIPITAYLSGSFLSEAWSSSIKKQHFMRWDTRLIAFECVALFALGFIPLSYPPQIVQVTINFLAAMQYNTFRQAEGVPVATTFCTNHVRQIGVALAKFVCKKDQSVLPRALLHFRMLLCFFAGGVVLTAFCGILAEKAIWIALIPLGIALCKLGYADFVTEKDLFEKAPSGH